MGTRNKIMMKKMFWIFTLTYFNFECYFAIIFFPFLLCVDYKQQLHTFTKFRGLFFFLLFLFVLQCYSIYISCVFFFILLIFLLFSVMSEKEKNRISKTHFVKNVWGKKNIYIYLLYLTNIRTNGRKVIFYFVFL